MAQQGKQELTQDQKFGIALGYFAWLAQAAADAQVWYKIALGQAQVQAVAA